METKKEGFFNLLTAFLLALCVVGAVIEGLLAQWPAMVWAIVAAGLVVFRRLTQLHLLEENAKLQEDVALAREERNNAWKQARQYEFDMKALEAENKRLVEENQDLTARLNFKLNTPAPTETVQEEKSSKRTVKRSGSGKKKISEIKEAVKDITENIKK